MEQTESSTYGWRGHMLRVDLTQAEIREETLADELLEKYIGGSALNARLFFDMVQDNPGLDPLSPENPLIFGCGPVVGTAFPCASRYTVTAKSPLTGIFGDSNAGGFFGVRFLLLRLRIVRCLGRLWRLCR